LREYFRGSGVVAARWRVLALGMAFKVPALNCTRLEPSLVE